MKYLTKKTGKNKLLAIITVLMMAISVIGFVPSVVKAEEPASEKKSFTVTASLYTVNGDNDIAMKISDYNKQNVTLYLEEYDDGFWGIVAEKDYSSSVHATIYSFESWLKGKMKFGVYYRIEIVKSGLTPEHDYSNVFIVADPSGGTPGGSETPGGTETPGGEEDPQKTCPHDRGWTSAGEDGSLKCLKCGFICDHKANTNTTKKKEDWESMYEQGHKHKYTIVCSVCNRKELEFEDPIEPHDYTGSKAEYAGDDQHRLTCAKCGYNTLVKCDYKVVKAAYSTDSSFPDQAAKGHDVTYVCKVCGHEEKVTCEKHTLVGGKCTVCGWKKVKPGKVSGIKVKVKSKKTVNKTFRSHGYFDYLGRWVSGKTSHSTLKICKVNVSFKKAKNGYNYKIQKTPGSGTTMNDSWITKKTSNTYEMWFKGGTGKVTLKITPYSKEGIKGKTIKKTFRV